jgi:hypothetical protein
MKKVNYLIVLGISVAAGTSFGMLSKRKNLKTRGLAGAAIGALAGSIAAGIYDRISTSNNTVTLYTKSSQMYENPHDVGYL